MGYSMGMGGGAEKELTMRSMSSRSGLLTYNEQEVVEILAKTRGYLQQMLEKIRLLSSSSGLISLADLAMCLSREGNLSDFEANKVGSFFAGKG